MVLETLLSPMKAERRPWEMFFIGFVYSSVALFLSLWIFPNHVSTSLVVLTTLATLPIIHGAIKIEERKDKQIKEERLLLKEHSRALSFFMFLFLGCVVAFSFWYLVLPENITNVAYKMQIDSVTSVNAQITGNVVSEMGMIGRILVGNLKVLFFCLLFSLFYGAGAIYVLAWNASIIGAAIGVFAKNSGYALGLARYLTHGIPEILSYFIAALAGGIISVAIIRHDFMNKKFKHILMDSIDLIILSIVVLVLAALIEAYVTPIFY